jgi:type IV secretion system protein VirB10
MPDTNSSAPAPNSAAQAAAAQPSQAAPLPAPAPDQDDKKPRGPFSLKTIASGAFTFLVIALAIIPALTSKPPKPKLTTVQEERTTAATQAKNGATQNLARDPAKQLDQVVSYTPSATQNTTYSYPSTAQAPAPSAYQPTATNTRPAATTPPQGATQTGPQTLTPLEQFEQTKAAKDLESLSSSPLVYTRDSAPKPTSTAPSALQPVSVPAQQANHQAPPSAPNSQPPDAPTLTPPVPTRPSTASGRHPGPLDNALNASNGPAHKLFEGTYIDAVLTTRINGTFAGPVNCMVTTNVWSHNRLHLLIPQGAHIIGEARRVEATGQQRLAVVFHRLIMPDGYSVSLDQFTGLNQIGETGLKDKVDNHYTRIFGTSLALGAIAGLGSLSSNSSGNASASNFSQGFSQTITQEAMQILNKYLNILPTVIIREGVRIKVYLTSDLTLPAYGDHRMPNDI